MMDTIEQSEEALVITGADISISAGVLYDLLTGALIATGSDISLPTLTGVHLTIAGGVLTATATDRYRLITGAVNLEPVDDVPQLSTGNALVFNKNLEEVTRALKPIVKRSDPRPVLISLNSDAIVFKLPEQVFTFTLLTGTFPPFEQLLSHEVIAVDKLAVNAAYMGDFAKIPTGAKSRGRVPVIFTFHGAGKIVGLTVHHPVIAWRGAIMPMRIN